MIRREGEVTLAIVVCLCAAVASAEVPGATAVAPAEALAGVAADVHRRVADGELVSAAVGVVQRGQTLWLEAVGWADRERRAPASTATAYPVASVSKSITATGIVALAARGELTLDSPLGAFLAPAALPAAHSPAAATVRHVLDHTSGIPHLWYYQYAERAQTLVGRSELIRAHAFAAFAPGRHYLYSNLGYGVLAEVIERVAGEPFQHAMRTTLLDPLEMRATRVDGWSGREGIAVGYHHGAHVPSHRLAPDGGAGFAASAEDLLRYARFHLGEPTDSSVPASAAIANALRAAPTGSWYWNGWGVVRAGAETLLISDGQALGASSVVLLVPEAALGVVCLTNQTGGPATDIALAAAAALVPGLAERVGARIAAIEEAIAAPVPLPVGRWHGELTDPAGAVPVVLEVPAEGSLRIALDGAPDRLLEEPSYEHGALVLNLPASVPFGIGRQRSLSVTFTLWPADDLVLGVATESYSDPGPRYGLPYRLRLRPAEP